MTGIRIVPEGHYRGEGISEGLARGLLVFYGPTNLTGEGMGIGSVAVKGDRCTYFSRSFTDAGDGESHITRTFFIDTKMSWSIGGKISPVLTELIECSVGKYMRLPRIQRILMTPVIPLRKMLRIQPVFETVPLRAKVRFTYHVDGSGVGILVNYEPVTDTPGTLCLLHELSANYFTASWETGTVRPPPPGWEPLQNRFPTTSLCDPVRGIRFWIDSLSVSTRVPVNIFWGRETGEDLSWAGISFEFGPPGPGPAPEIQYRVGFADGVVP
jgi:hypothetical protein